MAKNYIEEVQFGENGGVGGNMPVANKPSGTVASGGNSGTKPNLPPVTPTGGTTTGGDAAPGVTPNYSVNYNDGRFTQLNTQMNAALSELEQTYGDMIGNTDKFYNDQIQASKDWADKQTQLQNEKTDFAIEKIEQQKDQAHKDYLKEQTGAYVDWQKQSNQYGANAENMASRGMTGTGYSESSQVAMYNQYQNRVATAREVMANATIQYNNAITEARLQNNSILAEIAAEAYMKQLELALEGFQYKNSLVIDLTEKKMQVEDRYWQRQQDILAQINHENSMAEQVRQHNESLAQSQKQFEAEMAYKNAALAEEKRQYNTSMAFQKAQAAKSSSGGGGGSYVFDDGASGDEYEVSTGYYQGSYNPDVKNGVFKNGYQPNNINGVKLKKTGEKYEVNTEVKYGPDAGKKQTLMQNIWRKTDDNTLWYWDGRENKYIKIG